VGVGYLDDFVISNSQGVEIKPSFDFPLGFDKGNAPQKSYLVDPASSHMLVSKIKPCMSKYKLLYTVKLRTAHYISNNLFDGHLLHG